MRWSVPFVSLLLFMRQGRSAAKHDWKEGLGALAQSCGTPWSGLSVSVLWRCNWFGSQRLGEWKWNDELSKLSRQFRKRPILMSTAYFKLKSQAKFLVSHQLAKSLQVMQLLCCVRGRETSKLPKSSWGTKGLPWPCLPRLACQVSTSCTWHEALFYLSLFPQSHSAAATYFAPKQKGQWLYKPASTNKTCMTPFWQECSRVI